MAVTQTSWLAANDLRDYPLRDGAAIPTTALADVSLGFPASWDPAATAAVYADTVVVTPAVARLGISLDGYVNDAGTARILWLEVVNPIPGKVYAMTSGSSQAYGFVCFGSSTRKSSAVDAIGTATTAAFLPTVVNRYGSDAYTGVVVDGKTISGDVTFVGDGGLVCEVVPVYYDVPGESPEAVLSVVLRLEHDVATMTAPIVRCDFPVEAGTFDDVVTTLNGVRPTTDGTVYLQWDASLDYQYDADGLIVRDAERRPQYSTESVLQLEASPVGTLQFVDAFNYVRLCQQKVYTTPTMREADCRVSAAADYVGGGYDQADGLPISYAGARVVGNRLYINWAYYVQAVPQFGPDSLGIVITPQTLQQAAVAVVGLISCTGASPKLPGDLRPCHNTVEHPGELGEPVETAYALSRVVAAGERVVISGRANAIQCAGGTYKSPPFTSAVLTAELA